MGSDFFKTGGVDSEALFSWRSTKTTMLRKGDL